MLPFQDISTYGKHPKSSPQFRGTVPSNPITSYNLAWRDRLCGEGWKKDAQDERLIEAGGCQPVPGYEPQIACGSACARLDLWLRGPGKVRGSPDRRGVGVPRLPTEATGQGLCRDN